MQKFADLENKDTIIALASGTGGAIALLRISGAHAFEITQSIFSKDLQNAKSHTIHVGNLQYENTFIDHVVLSIFRAPHSYTGEDVIEISCHASPYIVQSILQTYHTLGVRAARAGEFTRRAFLHKKMDLVQAESVADLIASETQAQHKSASTKMRGALTQKLTQLKKQLLKLSARLELELDFSQEDVDFVSREALCTYTYDLRREVEDLLHTFSMGSALKKGVQIAIVGEPNAGKSTLLNSLVGDARAIVSSVAGTTRDTIEDVLHYDGFLFRFIDTAGLRDTNDEIERLGIARTYEKIRTADIVILLIDPTATRLCTLIDRVDFLRNTTQDYIVVINKSDLLSREEIMKKYAQAVPDLITLSAKDTTTLKPLLDNIIARVQSPSHTRENVLITSARHAEALQQIARHLADMERAFKQGVPTDLISPDLQHCLYYMASITGEIYHDDILDEIFSGFCIGK